MDIESWLRPLAAARCGKLGDTYRRGQKESSRGYKDSIDHVDRYGKNMVIKSKINKLGKMEVNESMKEN